MKKHDDDFSLVNLPEACQDPEIKQEDFVLTDSSKGIHEQKFQTKPTTFFKDSLKRFKKNKSSVVAAYILGALILLAIIVPLVSPYDTVNGNDSAFNNLQPKLFNNANGFWDGTVKKTNIPVDTSNPDKSKWMPDPNEFKADGISNYVIYDETFTENSSKYGREGYVEAGYLGGYDCTEGYLETVSPKDSSMSDYAFTYDLDTMQVTITNFETYDEDKIRAKESDGPKLPEFIIPEGSVVGNTVLQFVYTVAGEVEPHRVDLTPNKVVHSVGSTEAAIDVNAAIRASSPSITQFNDFYFSIKTTAVEGTSATSDVVSLISALQFSVNEEAPAQAKAYFVGGTHPTKSIKVAGISFTDANEMIVRETKTVSGSSTVRTPGYWQSTNIKYIKTIHMAKVNYSSFTYDGYKGQLGKRNMTILKSELETWRDNGWCDFCIEPKIKSGKASGVDVNKWNAFAAEHDGHGVVILSDSCPLAGEFTIDQIKYQENPSPTGDFIYEVKCDIMYYKYLGYSSIPSFLFGTDKVGRDLFKYVFEGLRNSLFLGILTFLVCFTFGLIWGAVSGYFGGTTDLVMERITDILSGLPWIVLMTIVILKAGRNFWTFALALCLTGWIGTASTTRTQFYRFRGREYVLASRTLGASDARLISKHVLPNALGTIITSSVLIIPSVIFSEATLAYLGLGFNDSTASLGVILSANEKALNSNPYQLLFPSVIIALVMISFNLFGNGLRDAINPSLKGEDQ